MPSWSRILKNENARPDGRWTVEVRQPVLSESTVANEEGADNGDRMRLEAEALLARAQQQAKELVRQGEARRAAIEKEAYKEGYQRGYAEALSQAKLEAERIRSEAKAVLAEARRLREELVAASEPEVVELAAAVAEQVVHRQLQVEPETVISMVRAALKPLCRREQLVVFVNPRDLELVRSEREALQQELSEQACLYFLADPIIAPGGCRIESEGGQVDATVDGQLHRLRRALLRVLSSVEGVQLVPEEGLKAG